MWAEKNPASNNNKTFKHNILRRKTLLHEEAAKHIFLNVSS